MSLVTSSQLGRIAACPASQALPHVNRESKWSKAGKAVHAFLEDCSNSGSAGDALNRVPTEFHDLCAMIALETLPHSEKGGYAAEVAFAFNVDTFSARELGRSIGREYVKHGLDPEREIGGSPDLVGVAENAVVVADLKTGYGWQTPDSWQMRANGAMAALAYQKDEAYMLTLIVHGDETVRLYGHMNAFEIADVARDMAGVFERAHSGIADNVFTIGEHCRYCPAMSFCPAQTKLVKDLALSAASPLTSADMAAQLTPESAREAWTKLKAAKGAIEAIDQAVRLFARQAPIDLGGGKWLGTKTKTTEVMDGGATLKVLRDKYGPEIADAVVEMTATKTRLKDAMREVAAKNGSKIAALEAEVIDAVRAIGGIRSRTVEEIREYGKRD